MTSLKSTNRRVGSLFAVAALVLATITPGLVPAFASAAQVTERSVTLSSSSRAATGVSYSVQFTPVGDAKAVVVDFCSDSPLIGATCTAPGGFTAAGAATVGGFTRTTGGSNDANTAIYTGTITAALPVTLTVNNVVNPSAAGALYVRIVTYDGADTTAAGTAAGAYTSTALGSGSVDQGSAAASITNTVGVSGAVLESMTFCVASNEIDDINCTRVDTDPLEAPTLRLGQGTGSATALQSSAVSEGSIYSQLSTNASGGAVVNLKSGNNCGGLKRAEATGCDIAAALATGVAVNEAKIGVKVSTGSDPATGASGTFQIAGAGAYYSSSVFKLGYDAGAATGVTSVFGDSVLDTADGPVSNKNAQITFGASITNDTPAGLYSNDYSLIATGKY